LGEEEYLYPGRDYMNIVDTNRKNFEGTLKQEEIFQDDTEHHAEEMQEYNEILN
jgi:hypothetical protein